VESRGFLPLLYKQETKKRKKEKRKIFGIVLKFEA
jgi:hypothetical protein